MQFKKVSSKDLDELKAFAEESELFSKPIPMLSSYVIKLEGKIICWLQLEYMDDQTYWLKKLFICEREALKLPDILQLVLQYVKKQQAKTIYVYSKRPITDLLLASFSFTLQIEEAGQLPYKNATGKWWMYHVS